MFIPPYRRYRRTFVFFLVFVSTAGEWLVFGGETPKNCNPIPYYPANDINYKIVRPNRERTFLPNLLPPSLKISPQSISSASSETLCEFSGTLTGSWEETYGFICFPFQDRDTHEELYAFIIGLRAESMGNNQYKSTWDKKVFWIDVGDRAPMHVCGIYTHTYELNGVVYGALYWSPNFMYLPPDADPNTAVPMDASIWLMLTPQNNVDQIGIEIYDEEGNPTSAKELAIGDRLMSYVPAIKRDEPDYFYGYTMENAYHTVKKTPVYFYSHLTPNVDFENEMTKDSINFTNVDLSYLLCGLSHDAEGVYEVEYTSPVPSTIKWGDSLTKSENWFVHETPSMINLLLHK